MVHMAVGQEQVVDRYYLIGGFADVKADIKLRDRYNSFFSCDGIAGNFDVVYFYFGKSVTWHLYISLLNSRYREKRHIRLGFTVCQFFCF